ncbi:MAG: amidase family protein, partial [Gammaproteobacteria bacterium]
MYRRQLLKAGLGAAALPLGITRSLFAAQLPADITAFSAIELSTAIRERQLSCFEVMEAYLSHINRYNPTYNAIINRIDDDTALVHAMAADRELDRGEYRGWMHGMPHAVKELQAVAGMRFTSGSRLYADRIAEQDSSMVARIREAGAIFIGKTNVPELGLGSQSYNPIYGATGSAWNPALTSGGSSGGAASGLGTHMLPVADGSDMMGSLRNPGAFNNVIGFRPSTNVMTGGAAEPRGLSTSGPMGRNVSDTIQLLQTIAVAPPRGEFSSLNLRNIRIGWMGNLNNYLAMEPGIVELCANSLVTLEREGVNVDSMLPRFAYSELWDCWTTLRHSGRASYQDEYNNPELRPLLKPELAWEVEQSMMLTDA